MGICETEHRLYYLFSKTTEQALSGMFSYFICIDFGLTPFLGNHCFVGQLKADDAMIPEIPGFRPLRICAPLKDFCLTLQISADYTNNELIRNT